MQIFEWLIKKLNVHDYELFSILQITYLHGWWVHNLRNCGAPLLWAGAHSHLLGFATGLLQSEQ